MEWILSGADRSMVLLKIKGIIHKYNFFLFYIDGNKTPLDS